MFDHHKHAIYAVKHSSSRSGRAVQRVALRTLAYCDSGFESRRWHGYLSLVSVVCCQVEAAASGWSLVQRSPNQCGISESDCGDSIMRPWPIRGCEVMVKNYYIKRIPWHIVVQFKSNILSVKSCNICRTDYCLRSRVWWNLVLQAIRKLNYELTAWNRILLDNLTGFQLVKKFPAFYGTRRFITAFTCLYPEPAQSSP
jgi:hypothetical protein